MTLIFFLDYLFENFEVSFVAFSCYLQNFNVCIKLYLVYSYIGFALKKVLQPIKVFLNVYRYWGF